MPFTISAAISPIGRSAIGRDMTGGAVSDIWKRGGRFR